MIKLEELSVIDLYEAWRLDGKLWLRSWSGDLHLIRVEPATLATELAARGVSTAEALQEWKEHRSTR